MLINGIEYKIASSTEEIKKAYELVYENYIEKRFCNLNLHKMRIFLFDSLLTTRTFIAKEGNEILATATLVFDSSIGLPSDGIYKDRLDILRKEKKSICEISKLSSRRDLGVKALRILPFLFRSCWLYAKEINPHNYFCIMVEPQNEGFYQKSYFFENNSEIRLDHKADEAPSILLEMPINYSKDSIDMSHTRASKLCKMHFDDPDIEKIIEEFNETEATISRINLSLQPTRKSRTLALTSEEKKFLEFKFFIIRYNLDQISRYAHSQTSKGWLHDAVESYENLMKTLPNWAFSKEKDQIYEKLCELFLTTGFYEKLVEMGQKLKNSHNINSSIQGRNMQAVGLYLIGKLEAAFEMLDEAELMAREINDDIRLSRNLYCKAMLLNHQKKYEEALSLITEAKSISINENASNQRTRSFYLLSFSINQHLGRIKECKLICDKFTKEFDSLSENKDLKIQSDYYSCLSRYYIFRLHHKKAINCLEILLNTVERKDEMPWAYSVHLATYSACLLNIGEIDMALVKIQEALALKAYCTPMNYINYLLKKMEMLIYKNDFAEIVNCKNEIESNIISINRKPAEFQDLQNTLIIELHLKGDVVQILKRVEKFSENNIWNKPQLSGEIDMATIQMLLGKSKKARKYLLADLMPHEEEIVGSDIDNNKLIKIYFDLVENKLEDLIEDLHLLFEKVIQKEEVISKCKISLNILRIIDVQNKSRTSTIYLETRKKIIALGNSILVGKNIPAVEKLFV